MTCASFLPLFAGICTEERAVRLVSVLTDPDRFWSEMPVPSISLDDPAYGSDMWRGPVWLNYNYMIMQGLRKYGYTAEAEELCRRTLTAVRKVFDETGSVFEFYDPEVKTIPWSMRRKGTQPPVPDYRIKMLSRITIGLRHLSCCSYWITEADLSSLRYGREQNERTGNGSFSLSMRTDPIPAGKQPRRTVSRRCSISHSP